MTDSKAWWVKCENIIREGCVPVGETGWERVFLARDYDASEARAEKAEAELAVWLTPLREAFGLVSTLALHRIADPSHPIDWAKGIVKDVHEQQNRIVEEVRKAEAVADAADRHALACRNELEVVSRLRADADAERDDERAKHLITQRKLAEMWAERDRLAGTVERVRALARRLRDSGTHANEACNIENALADPVSETFTRLNSYGVPYESRNGRGLTGHDARGRRHEDTHNCVRYTPLTWDRRKRERRHGDDCGTLTCGRRKADSDRRKPPATYPRCRECGKWKQP